MQTIPVPEDPYGAARFAVEQILRGEPVTIFGDGDGDGDGEQTRAFTYIDAVAKPMAACIDSPRRSARRSTSEGRPYSVNRLVEGEPQ